MTLTQKISGRKLTLFIAGGAAAIALGIGGYAIADATSSSGASGSANAGNVVPFERGTPGNGEYNVHMIAVNWPHHVFVDKNFKVVGAE